MSKFVRIQSTVTINVTPGLQNIDVTNEDAHIPDRLKVNALWMKATVLIKEGVGTYPAFIKDWHSVQALAKAGVLTIGAEVDDGDEKLAQTLERSINDINEESTETYVKQVRRRSKKSLEEVAE